MQGTVKLLEQMKHERAAQGRNRKKRDYHRNEGKIRRCVMENGHCLSIEKETEK